MMVGSFKR
jgi:hypothetical protein